MREPKPYRKKKNKVLERQIDKHKTYLKDSQSKKRAIKIQFHPVRNSERETSIEVPNLSPVTISNWDHSVYCKKKKLLRELE